MKVRTNQRILAGERRNGEKTGLASLLYRPVGNIEESQMSLETVTKENRLPGLISRVDGFCSYNWWRRWYWFRTVLRFLYLHNTLKTCKKIAV